MFARILLLLTTPNIIWESPRLLPVALISAGLLVLAVVWLYPAQVRFVRFPWRWLMPGLRAAALAALAVALARPVVVRTEAVGQGGTVAVLVDHSASMDVADTQRKSFDLVALADSFGLLPPGSRGAFAASQPAAATRPSIGIVNDTFSELRSAAAQAFRAQSDLEYSRVSGQGIDAAEARVTESAARVSALGASLAGMAQQLPGDDSLRKSLEILARMPRPDGRGTWVGLTRRLVEEAGSAISKFQDSSDDQLYASSQQIRDICESLKTHTRFQLECAALLRPEGGLVARMRGAYPLRGFAFADDLIPLGPLNPNASAALSAWPGGLAAESPPSDDDLVNPPPPPAGSLLSIAPDGLGTNLAGSVTTILNRLDARKVRAVVLFSDGREVGGDINRGIPPAAAGVPVFAVAVAPDSSPRDVTFSSVRVDPPAAFVGEAIQVRATLRATGISIDPSRMRLFIGGLGTDPIKPSNSGPSQDGPFAEFSVKLQEPGVQSLTVQLPDVPEAATTKNKSVQRWVKVMPDRIRVAAYATSPVWDFQFLRSALSATPWIRLESGLLDPDHPRFPLSPEQILQQDVLLLDDVPASALSAEQWDAVYNKLVKERGGTVILVAGSSNAVQSYENQIAASALLPFNPARVRPTWKVWPGQKPDFRIVPAAGWERSDFREMLRLDNLGASNRRWQELPALYRLMPVPVALLRPNARPLLVQASTANQGEGAKADWAVLSESRPGLGRTLFLGIDETWRWRMGAGERFQFQERFWTQLIRYAAEEPYAAREGAAALDLNDVSVDRGEPVRVRARLYDSALQVAAAATTDAMRLEIRQGDRVLRTLSMSPGSADGRWRAVISGLGVGDYEVRLLAPPSAGPGAQAQAPLQLPLHVTASTENELRNLKGDPDRLRSLAESTGGEMLRLDQIGTLPDRLAHLGETHPRVSRLSLWDSPYLLVFVVSCLAGEWALRKRFGLA